VDEPILLVSVSARMLAELAVNAGHDVIALDRFGDLDLQRLCPSVSVLRDFGGRGGMAALVDAAQDIPAPSVICGAGLENRPALVARLAAGRRLLGCSPETLERVRDPAVLGASLRAAGFAYPRTYGAADAPRWAERSRRWLRKPVRGGGGRGVREWRGGALGAHVVVQERISGLACSAAAVADGHSAVVLGVSEQLIGCRRFGGHGFAWCGNVVPPRLGAAQRRGLALAARTICAHLGLAFGMRGLFGVDLVWDGERAWVIEVNARPTASLECIEAAHGVAVFAAHLEGCTGRLPSIPDDRTPPRAGPDRAAGKAILYAAEDMRVGDTRGWRARGIRDVPHPGERIAARHPICTLVSVQQSPDAVFADLEGRAAALRDELGEGAVSRFIS
jgi:predicted ATP-grasp superfamily ATP-dependent carboligase